MGSVLAAAGVLALLGALPGPDVAVVTRFAIVGEWAAGVRAGCGVVLGLVVWGAAPVLGLAAVRATWAVAYTVVKLAGAAYLIALGLRAWWSSSRSTEAPDSSSRAARHPLRLGLLTNLLNPKIAVFCTALLPSLVPAGASTAAAFAALVLLHAGLSLAWLSGCAWATARSSALLAQPKARRWLERLTGTALVGFGVRVAVEAR